MQDAAQQVHDWITHWVIAENLCPYAEAPMNARRVAIVVSEASDEEGVYQAFLQQVERLLANEPDVIETLVLALPNALAEFDDYLDLLAACEAALDELGLAGVLQIASFHPDYCFADVSVDDPANYSNRSPMPLLHLLREDSLTEALAGIAHPERIPARNQAHLRKLGLEEIRRRFSGAA